MSQSWVFHLQPHRCWSVLAFGKAELKRWVVYGVLHVGKFSFGVLPEGAGFKGSDFLWEREGLLQLKLRRAHKTVSTELTFSGSSNEPALLKLKCTSSLFSWLSQSYPVLLILWFNCNTSHECKESDLPILPQPVTSTGLSGSVCWVTLSRATFAATGLFRGHVVTLEWSISAVGHLLQQLSLLLCTLWSLWGHCPLLHLAEWPRSSLSEVTDYLTRTNLINMYS